MKLALGGCFNSFIVVGYYDETAGDPRGFDKMGSVRTRKLATTPMAMPVFSARRWLLIELTLILTQAKGVSGNGDHPFPQFFVRKSGYAESLPAGPIHAMPSINPVVSASCSQADSRSRWSGAASSVMTRLEK